MAALLVLATGCRKSEIESLIPIVRESRVPLILGLDRAEQTAGFPPGTDYLKPFTDARRNVDDGGIPFPMPLTGRATFPRLPLHPGARLRFGYGIEVVADAAATGATVSFSVHATAPQERGGPRKLFEAEIAAGAPGAAPVRESAEVELPADLSGDTVDLVFAVETRARVAEAGLIPVFTSPVLTSSGVKVRARDLTIRSSEIVADLVERYDAATDADDGWEHVSFSLTPETCFAVRRDADGTETPLPRRAGGIAPAFRTDAPNAARSAPMPALCFSVDEYTVARYPIDVPAGGARLEFHAGVEERSIAVGTATFSVTVDGDVVFAVDLDPGRRPEDRGWRPCSVDLSPYAGRRVLIGLLGEVLVRAPVVIQVTEEPLLGSPKTYELEVRHVLAAFGRPRVVRDVQVRRRLSKKVERPSVVVVNVETLRQDEPSCYGGIPGITPTLDRLAAEGVLIEECVTAAPWTSPSVASLFTGLYPWSHGVTSYTQSYLFESVETLAERAARAGVTTASFVTNELVASGKNFDQGFETAFFAPYANARQIVSTFADWLVDHHDLQFLAYLHLFEPHHPLNAPGEDLLRYVPAELRELDPDVELARIYDRLERGESVAPDDDGVRLLRGLYRGEVRYLDRQLDRLMQEIARHGLAERVIVVVTGDHGEEFLEHGLIGHGSHVYGETVLVPLVIHGPGIVPAGRRVEGPVENPQLYATILDWLDVDYPRESCRPALRLDRDNGGTGQAYTSTEQGIRRIEAGDEPRIFTKTIHGLRTRDASLVYSPRGRTRDEPAEYGLFDLGADPGERVSRHAERQHQLEEMKARLRKAYDVARRAAHGVPIGELDAATLKTLAELGYVEGTRTDAGRELFDDEFEDDE